MFGFKIVQPSRGICFIIPTPGRQLSLVHSVERSHRQIGGPCGLLFARRSLEVAEEYLADLDPGAPCGEGDGRVARADAWREQIVALGGIA